MMRRWFKRALLLVAGLCALALAGFVYALWSVSQSDWDLSGADDAHWEARDAFLQALGDPACLTRDAILTEAAARGFPTRDLETDLMWCHSPTGLQDWLGVEISPGMFMSTQAENTAFFGFDDGGCSVPWVSASGPGTTCP